MLWMKWSTMVNMARTKKEAATDELVDNIIKKGTTPKDPVTEALDNAKKVGFQACVTIGLMPNGLVDLVPSHPDYGVMHALLNRAIMELTIHEREAVYKQLREEATKE